MSQVTAWEGTIDTKLEQITHGNRYAKGIVIGCYDKDFCGLGGMLPRDGTQSNIQMAKNDGSIKILGN